MNISEAIVGFILSHENNALRFERFCNSLVGDLEGGIQVLATSRTWDMGIDGRVRTSHVSVFTCCSLTGKVESKSKKDITRLAGSGSAVERIYFCSSQNLSELQATRIEAELRDLLPAEVIINVYGREMLAQLAAAHQEYFLKHYRQEVEQCLAVLQDLAV